VTDTEIEVLASSAQLVPLAQLRPAPWNPRTLKGERFKNRMNGEIYAGNQRYLAQVQLGRETIWAHLEDVSEQLAKERALRDNNEWGSWDDEKLSDMLADLKRRGTDVGLLGFTDKELTGLTTGRALPEPGDQDVDETVATFGVVVTCKSEEEQVMLLERLTEEGYDVRALVS
jgi:ParB-like chromosome segregation protein Spo0J